MTRKTNTKGRAADEEAQTSTAAEKPEQEPATKPATAEAAETDQGAKAPSRAAASAPDPEGQVADQGAQTSAAAEGSAQGPEATEAPAKTGEADAGSPAPGSEEAGNAPEGSPHVTTEAERLAALSEEWLAPVHNLSERLSEHVAAAMVGPEPSGLEVVVVGPARGRWRAGRHFGAAPVRIPVEELTEDEKAALVADPVLIVSVPEVSRRP